MFCRAFIVTPRNCDKLHTQRRNDSQMYEAQAQQDIVTKPGKERYYFVFIHYDVKKYWSSDRSGGLVIRDDDIALGLERELRYLATILEPEQGSGTGWRGFAFIFLDPGWLNLLRASDAMTMADLTTQLSFHRSEIVRLLKSDWPNFDSLFQIVMADQLVALLQALRRQWRGEDFTRWLTGDPSYSQLRYDSAKVVEAVIRIAHIGRNVPILRFDDDVVFSGCRQNAVDPYTRAARTRQHIFNLCETYRDLSEDSQVGYFMFSGPYAGSEVSLGDGHLTEDPSLSVEDLVNSFATRVVQVANVPQGPFHLGHPAIIDPRKAATFLNTLVQVGANPFGQVISGAGLCLSDSAVIDLPPFSNMRLHVMWIDDHLKYALHHELGHFGIHRRTHHTARAPGVSFAQSRYGDREGGTPTLADVKWHIQTYLMRLILGCVADAWLREVPELKMRLPERTDAAYQKLMTNVPGPYADALFGAVLSGNRDSARENDRLRELLWQKARERLRTLEDLWSSEHFHGTFLELFMRSPAARPDRRFDDFLPIAMRNGFSEAFTHLSENRPDFRLATTYDAGSLPLDLAISVLIEDFVEYFDFVIFWRHFVASVRLLLNLRQGRGHVLWMIPPPIRC